MRPTSPSSSSNTTAPAATMNPEILQGLIDVPQTEAALLLEAGYLFLELGRAKEAEEIFAGVNALLPNSDVPLVALGNIEFAQGRYQRALKYHQDALKLRPTSALAQAHIGECLLFLKKHDEAVKALQASLQLDDKGPSAAFAKALLDAHQSGELRP